GKSLLELAMDRAVTDVGEIGRLGTELEGYLDRLLDVEVSRVGVTKPEGIEHKHLHPLELAQGARGKPLGVSDVPEVAYAESEYFDVAVGNGQRRESEARDLDRLVWPQHVQLPLRPAGAGDRCPHVVEDVI